MNDITDQVRRLVQRISAALTLEVSGIHPKLHWMTLVERARLVRASRGCCARTMRSIGFQIGTDTIIAGMPRINGGKTLYHNLVMGEGCFIDVDTLLDLSAHVTIGDRVTIGAQVMILTSTHELGPREHRAGRGIFSPVVVGNGCWLGPRSILLPGTSLGEGVIVEPGTVVNTEVPANARVAGVPARVIDTLESR